MNKKVLIFLDPQNLKNSIDLLEVTEKLYGESVETYAIHSFKDKEQSFGYFDYLFGNRLGENDFYNTKFITDYIEKLHHKHLFDAVLIPATFIGRILAPRIARRLHTGLVADVTDLKTDEGELEMIRPAFSGKIMAGIVNVGKGPLMMTVRQNVFQYHKEATKNTLVIDEPITQEVETIIRVLDTEDKTLSYDIRDSEVLISGGGGAKHIFHRLEELSDLLKGNVSASRKLVDQGLATRAVQVGQSGKTVTPRLYIALGIDGAIQHVEGLKNVEHIISVNLNKNAPICALSDIVVQGDASQFVEKLIARINMK
jgi:electron transfer flavoprotein alpha subunit